VGRFCFVFLINLGAVNFSSRAVLQGVNSAIHFRL
jgi:hypothetical protein